jgi:hypothetical protein
VLQQTISKQPWAAQLSMLQVSTPAAITACDTVYAAAAPSRTPSLQEYDNLPA